MGVRIYLSARKWSLNLYRNSFELIMLIALLSFSASAFPSSLSGDEALFPETIWNLEENYSIVLENVYYNASPPEVLFQIRKNNNFIDEKTISLGSEFNYINGKLLINFTLDDVFGGTFSRMVKLKNINQFSEINGDILINNQSHLFIAGNIGGVDWGLGQNYKLKMVDANLKTSPAQVWLQYYRNGTLIDDKVVQNGSYYTYSNSSTDVGIILSLKIAETFEGSNTLMVKVENVSQYCEVHGPAMVIKSNETHQFVIGNISGADWGLGQKYKLKIVDANVRTSPGQVWLQYYRNGTLVDDKVVQKGNYYKYSNSSTDVGTILSMKIADILDVSNNYIVKLENVDQFCEVHGPAMVIKSNESHQFITETKTEDISLETATAIASPQTIEKKIKTPEETTKVLQSMSIEKSPGFGLILALAAIIAVFMLGLMRR